jgi:SAM-dependent methyltransferase
MTLDLTAGIIVGQRLSITIKMRGDMLAQTRGRTIHSLKAFLFDKLGLQEVLERREKQRLEDMMGFRGQFDEHRRFQITFLKKWGLVPSHRLLEIGCGPLTAGIPIIDYLEQGNYVGTDVRSSVLDSAWQEVGKAGMSVKNPRLISSPSFASVELGDQQFDFILSFSVLFHLSDDILASYFDTVCKRLRLGGVCFANVNVLSESSRWLEFPFIKRTIENYREVASKYGLEATSLGEIGDLGFRLSGAERHNQMLSFRIKKA